MAEGEYSPQLFTQLVSTGKLTSELSNVTPKISEFTGSLSGLAASLDVAVERVNRWRESLSEERWSLRRDTRECRSNFCKTLVCAGSFVDRFDKLLRFGEMDQAWKGKMVDSVSKGERSGFSAYISQLSLYLEQCSECHTRFKLALEEASSHCRTISNKFNSRAWRSYGNHRNRDTATVIAVGVVSGVGVSVLAKIVSYDVVTAMGMGLAIGTAIYLMGKYINTPWTDRRGQRDAEGTFQKLCQGYDSLSVCATKLHSSLLVLQESLRSLAPRDVQEQEGVGGDLSFCAALDELVGEMKRAHVVVQSCYGILDRGISVARIIHA